MSPFKVLLLGYFI